MARLCGFCGSVELFIMPASADDIEVKCAAENVLRIIAIIHHVASLLFGNWHLLNICAPNTLKPTHESKIEMLSTFNVL